MNGHRRVAALLLVPGLLLPAALAEEAATPVHFTLDGAIRAALGASPDLQALAHSAAAVRRQAQASSRSRFGVLDAVATTERFEGDRITLPISSEMIANGLEGLPFDRNQRRFGLSFHVPLFAGGRLRSERELARLDAREAVLRLAGGRWQTRFNAASLYGSVAALDASLDAARGERAALDATRARVALELEQGRRARIDLLKIDDALAQIDARIAGLEGQRRRSAALLLALCGRDPSLRLTVEPLDDDAAPDTVTGAASLHAALAESSSVALARAEEEESRHRERIAQSAFLPRLEAGGLYLSNDAPSMPESVVTWELRLDVRIPLLAGGSRFARVAAAREARRAAASRVERARLAASAALEGALAGFHAARTSLDAARRRVDAAEEAARIEDLRYDVGSGRIEDLLRARAREAEARSALAAARSAVIVARARIEFVAEKEIRP